MISATLPLANTEAALRPQQALRRVSLFFLALAVCAAILAALYGSHYILLGLQIRLPEVSGTAWTLAYGYAAVALLCLGWGWVLGQLQAPHVARRVHARLQATVSVRRPEWLGWSVAAGVAMVYAAARFAASETIDRAELDMLAAGEASLPFQYRALVPWLVRGLAESAEVVELAGTFSYMWAYGIVEVVAAFGIYAAFRFWLGEIRPLRASRDLTALVVFVPLLFTFALPHRYNPFFFPWDTPSVALFTLGLALLYRRDWRWYYPLFIVATLNRETTCFLAVAFLFLYAGRERPLKLAGHMAAQAAIWLSIKYGLFVLYAENPLLVNGPGLFVYQIQRSLRLALTLPAYIYLLLAMGGLWVPVLLLRSYLRDRRVARTLAVAPVFLLGMFFVGELLEMRIYGELIPIVTVAALLIGRAVLREAASNHIAARSTPVAV